MINPSQHRFHTRRMIEVDHTLSPRSVATFSSSVASSRHGPHHLEDEQQKMTNMDGSKILSVDQTFLETRLWAGGGGARCKKVDDHWPVALSDGLGGVSHAGKETQRNKRRKSSGGSVRWDDGATLHRQSLESAARGKWSQGDGKSWSYGTGHGQKGICPAEPRGKLHPKKGSRVVNPAPLRRSRTLLPGFVHPNSPSHAPLLISLKHPPQRYQVSQ